LLYLFWLFSKPAGRITTGSDKLRFLYSIYSFGPDDYLKLPHNLTVDKYGNLYVADTGNKRVLVFDSNGAPLWKFGSESQFAAPTGVGVADDNGDIYVTDRLLNQVFVFNKKGKLKKSFYMHLPLMPQVVKDRVYITTFGTIFITDRNGKVVQKYGSRGRNPGQFDFPNGIAVDKKGNMFISDLNNLRVQALTKDGEIIWIQGTPPTDLMASSRRFGLPAGIAIDEKQRLYLVDAFHNSIVVLDNKGNQIAELGEKGSEDGQFFQPAGIAYFGNGKIAVADKFNNRIEVFRINL
jgi:DNA-binding beta-propeller fold protein YncE